MPELHPTTFLQAAAWVPDDDPKRPWEEAADLAAAWIWARSEIEGVLPLVADLDRAIFFGGNNGWSGQHEKTHARGRLATHVESGRLAPDEAAAYVMSQGVSDKGATRLRTLLEKYA
ncbi:hypothetical protein ACWKWN_03280 [Microbacterium trichothecenolyticum]